MGVGFRVRPNPQEPKGIVRQWASFAAFLLLTFLRCSLPPGEEASMALVVGNSRIVPGKGW